MDNDIVLSVNQVSKKYCKSFKRSLIYSMKDISRNALGLSSYSDQLRKDEFWAINDISFEVRRGETLGIIGSHGAGKSTLLKMLNGIIWPDTGKIKIRGRVCALVEAGTWFHPLQTGRENIYNNGAILGMSKNEIDEILDDIMQFADIDDFIDVPVKFYSGKMLIRLGFTVGLYCEPDILLVDEVLAVGDSFFKNMCTQKMKDLTRNEDITVIFVSHDFLQVERLCDRGIYLNNGTIMIHGEIIEVIQAYQSEINKLNKTKAEYIPGLPYRTMEVEIVDVKYIDRTGKEQIEFFPGDTLGIRVEYSAQSPIPSPIFQISINNRDGVHISVFGTHIDKIEIKTIQDRGTIECWIDKLPLLMNNYYVTVEIYNQNHNTLFDYWNGALYRKYFQILPNQTSLKMATYTPIFQVPSKWNLNGIPILIDENTNGK